MKHFIICLAVFLLTTEAPALARSRNVDADFLSASSAQDSRPAITRKDRRVVVRRKRSGRRRCRRIVVVRPSGAAVTTPSGLTYIVTRRTQERQPQPGETVQVNYTGLLGSGAKFDSSLDRGQPIEFPLGKGRVIKGWDEGISKLRIGEQATLIIPAELGYGARGAGGVIPPNATLIFLVELVGIKQPAPANPSE